MKIFILVSVKGLECGLEKDWQGVVSKYFFKIGEGAYPY